jgi:hypothetical protein
VDGEGPLFATSRATERNVEVGSIDTASGDANALASEFARLTGGVVDDSGEAGTLC